MSQLLTSQLPPLCLVVWQAGWTFNVELRVRRQVQQQRWCKTFDELVRVVTDIQFRAYVQKKELPTYLLHGATQRCEPLSYERAHQLAIEAK